ncbi:CocE/NonD family hydrolase [Kitasatospora sp. NPDC059327]|uniref:CocE/NonD family hydrolase n=1 Tax=Kitasatospora sp. NPDC059327 TaxID=3346803 RepID=UPI0036851A86
MPSHSYRTVREDARVPLADGTELYARLWRPVTDDPVPVLLEYSTGRLTDRTASDDARRHPWYAGHGYAAVRVDARGHGNSGGRPNGGSGDENGGNRDGELADGADLLRRFAAEPWCSGRIGLLGTGPAGATALRLAAHAPDAVQAVVTACPDGGHRLGGAALATDLHTRATARLADAALPPDPLYVADDWRALWRERLDALEPDFPARFAPGWGGLPDTAAVPTLAVAGWGDPSCAAVLRLLADGTAAVPVRAVLGPWPHGLPDDVLTETLRWWDHWLKDTDTDTGALRTPALRSWISGRWTADDPWPSPDVRAVRYGLDGPLRTAGTASDDRHVHVRSPQHTGLDAGAYVPLDRPADRPPDQREEDGRSVCFDSQPLPEPLELLGTPSLRLRLRPPADAGRDAGPIVARLCDVAPDGTSTLLTRGALLTSAGAPDVTVDLAAAGHTVPSGHRLRLALSCTYWPWLWPDPEPAGFGVDPSRSTLTLPVRHLAADAGAAPVVLASPTLPLPPPVHLTEPLTARPERLTVHDIARHEWRTELSPASDGSRTHPDGLVRDEHTVTAYRILTAAPTSAQARSDRTVRLERPAIGWDVTVQTRTELRCTPTHFLAHTHLTALEAGGVVFTRDWQQRIPRDTV